MDRRIRQDGGAIHQSRESRGGKQKASARGMLVGTKDVARRSAATLASKWMLAEEVLEEELEARYASAVKFVDQALKVTATKTRKTSIGLTAAKGICAEQYYTASKEYADIKTQDVRASGKRRGEGRNREADRATQRTIHPRYSRSRTTGWQQAGRNARCR